METEVLVEDEEAVVFWPLRQMVDSGSAKTSIPTLEVEWLTSVVFNSRITCSKKKYYHKIMKVSFKKMQLVEKKYAVFTLIGRNLELLRRGEKPLVCTSSPDVYQQLGKKLVLIFLQIQISSLSSSVYLVQVGLLILLVYNSKKDI